MMRITKEYYSPKSYPYEAYGGAMRTCAACKKLRRDMARINKERVRLRDELIRLVDELIDKKTCWDLGQDDIANDYNNPL
jgi:hypothetical protein